MKTTLLIIVVLISSVFLASCGGSSSPSVTIIPNQTIVVIDTTFQFEGFAVGELDTTVTWSVQEAGGGSINGGGLYTAPHTPGTFHVIATSNADNTVTAKALVTVTN